MSAPACETCGAEAGPTHGERRLQAGWRPAGAAETSRRCRWEVQENRRLGHPPVVLNRIERIGIFEHQWTVPDTSAAVSATLHRLTSLVVSQIGRQLGHLQ